MLGTEPAVTVPVKMEVIKKYVQVDTKAKAMGAMKGPFCTSYQSYVLVELFCPHD